MSPAVGPTLTKSRETQIRHSRDEPVGAEGLGADLLFSYQLTRGGKALARGLEIAHRVKNAARRGIRRLIPSLINGTYY
jgi:hypothetical protein